MKAASIDKSERLRRVDDLLADGAERSTLEIIQQAGVVAVNSIVSELRANGREIHCRRLGSRWLYRRLIR